LGGDQATGYTERFDARWLATVRKLRLDRRVGDRDWDLGYPRTYAELSQLHWTPISVARRAAALLSRGPSSRILDVGAGVGEFCTIAALTTPGVFIGVERWGEMVDIACETARKARVSKARFIHARAEDIDWANFDGFYFFNPYAELGRPRLSLVHAGVADPLEYQRIISFTEESLGRARSGARVVTYFGFGGELPSCFRLLLREPHGTDFVECWEKA
jgi:SAM-dependent methyltransferase